MVLEHGETLRLAIEVRTDRFTSFHLTSLGEVGSPRTLLRFDGRRAPAAG